MPQPTYGAPWRPLADVYGEQWVFEPLTSDPANTENGDHWLRVDLDSGDKLATLRWDHGSGVWDIPVFAVGDSRSGVEEVLRVQTPNGLGFVPLANDANYQTQFPQLGFQHGGTRYDLHDSPYAIPDSGGTHQWNYEENSGTTVADEIGSLDVTFNQLSWGSNAGAGDTFGLLDGTDDYGDTGSNSAFNHFTDGLNGTLFAWVRCDDVAGQNAVASSAATSSQVGIGMEIRDGGDLRVVVSNGGGVGDDQASVFPTSVISDGVWTPVAMTIDSGTLTAFSGDPLTDHGSDTHVNGGTTSNHDENLNFGRRPTENDFFYDGGLDLMWTDNTAWTQSELQTFVDDSSGLYS